VIVEGDPERVAARAAEVLGIAERATATGTGSQRPVPARGADGTRAFVKVQDGCDAACAYCIVPRARGRSRSLDRQRIASELQSLAELATPEVVLTGINLGRYDATGGLPALVEAAERAGIPQHDNRANATYPCRTLRRGVDSRALAPIAA
jgi:tRNA A37 methylthiotransferase MiaB